MSSFKIKKEQIENLFVALSLSYRIIGPKIESGTLVFSEITFKDLPIHVKDIQGPGRFRLSEKREESLFSFSVGPDSFKRFLFPTEEEILTWKYNKKSLIIESFISPERPVILFGLRACDIEALKLYDRIFSEDDSYRKKRANSVTIAINCLKPGDNCFCYSLNTGPEVKGADVVITELKEYLLIEINSDTLLPFLAGISSQKPLSEDWEEKERILNNCKNAFKKQVDTRLFKTLFKKIEDPLWAQISEKDLECGNCTQVCPTCFCNSTYDRIKLTSVSKNDVKGTRIRTWDSCFSRNFARVHGGNFRLSRRARYRHWFMHKFLYMEEQFGMPGCVGCGRCITWCPAGIDVTDVLGRLQQ
ncbi:MAG: 4Fe-4S dicluster domain-containing protein [Thermodesulfovibrionales bacterium]|nr:4Fe-4S dicluster domain-containing protein [Thermodesulfovibrionales bacterium]